MVIDAWKKKLEMKYVAHELLHSKKKRKAFL